MVVIWQEQAQNDLKNYIQNSRIYTSNKVNTYVNTLVDYVSNLETSPLLGKIFYIYNNVEIRQLLFKMHRIIYYIKEDKIIIVEVVHTARNVDTVIKYLTDYFNYQ